MNNVSQHRLSTLSENQLSSICTLVRATLQYHWEYREQNSIINYFSPVHQTILTAHAKESFFFSSLYRNQIPIFSTFNNSFLSNLVKCCSWMRKLFCLVTFTYGGKVWIYRKFSSSCNIKHFDTCSVFSKQNQTTLEAKENERGTRRKNYNILSTRSAGSYSFQQIFFSILTFLTCTNSISQCQPGTCGTYLSFWNSCKTVSQDRMVRGALQRNIIFHSVRTM